MSTAGAREVLPSVRPVSAALCAHCRTPLPRGASDGFCCRGCRRVYELLSASGLDRYYKIRGERELAPVRDGMHGHEAPWLEALEAQTAGAAVRRLALDVQGLQCGACVWLIEALFKRESDAYRATVNPALGQLTCTVGPGFDLRRFVSEVEAFGYRLGPAQKGASEAKNALLLRTGVCLALAANNMLLGASTYFGLERGPLYELVQNASFGMATLSALVGGSYFVERALVGLRHGILHLDLPIAVGMGLAYAGSVWSLFFDGARASYLDTVSVFIALMLVGRLLQERLVEKNRRQLLASDGASGLLARRVAGGRAELVACPSLRAGDELLVCSGEIVPVRAALENERAQCALDWINGESEPRAFAHGDELVAGAVNVGPEPLRVRALVDFAASDLDALLRDDDSAKRRLSGDFWDLLSRTYVWLVLLVTAVGAALWTLRGAGFMTVLDISTAVLVVTCPCAFGIATPLAYELAVAGLRKKGLYVRDSSFFDRAARVKRIVFDKTGTLTTGALELKDPEVLSTLSAVEQRILYTLTAQSNHPKSQAVARALADLSLAVRLGAHPVHEEAGRGVETVADGVRYRVGDPSWAALTGPSASEGSTEPVFTANGVVLAQLACVEVARPSADREVRTLTAEGYELWIASGDEPSRVRALADQLRVPAAHVRANLSPEDKRALIDSIDARDTMMIGDGINDGPALSRAYCSGTPAVDRPFVPARSDFYFLTAGLEPVRAALRAAHAVRRVVLNALIFATAYNVFAVSLCYLGWMRPWLAAVLMPSSSIAVLLYTALSLSPRSRLWRS